MTCGGTPGIVPCSGYHGRPCPNKAWVKESREKCKPCWRQEEPPNPGRDQMPPPQEPPQNKVEIHEDNLEAVKAVASVLARYNEPGFQNIPFTGDVNNENE